MIYSQNGMQSLFQGFSATLYRNVPTYGLFFAVNATLLSIFTESYDYGLSGHLAAGGLAGTASWIACFPADIIKTRMQSDHLDPAQR